MGFGVIRSRPIGEQLERAAANAAAMRVVSGGAGVSTIGSRASSLTSAKAIKKALGGPCFLRQSDSILSGIGPDGSRRDLGACSVSGKQVAFDWWLPHLGIAFDTFERTDAEVSAKVAWALERRILYYPPDTELAQIADAARQRRELQAAKDVAT